MTKKRKREFESSELVKVFAKKFGLEEKLVIFEIQDFLADYLDEALFQEIREINIDKGILSIKISSPLLKNDFRMRKSYYLQKFQQKFGIEKIKDILIK